MKALVPALTALFWLAVAGLFVAREGPSLSHESPPAPAASAPALADPAERRVTATELARHASPSDCWMAIEGVVVDVTAYLPGHPAEPGLLEPWCGRDATEAYRVKPNGRPHSPRADRQLAGLRVGRLP